MAIEVAGCKSIAEMQDEVCEWTKRKGWWDDGRTFGDIVALAHSELSEALEEFREGRENLCYRTTAKSDPTCTVLYVGGIHTDCICGNCKPEGAAVEFADLFIRMLHTCAHYGWDLEKLYELKMAYNEKRPFRHGGKAL